MPALVQEESRRMRVSNAAIRLELLFRGGSFRAVSLVHLNSGREWIHPRLPSEEFLFEVAGQVVSGKGPLEWVGVEQRQEGVWKRTRIRLRHSDPRVSITRNYLCHANLPVIRQQTLVRNDAPAPLLLKRGDVYGLRVSPVPEPLRLHWMDNFGRAMLPSPGNPIHYASLDENIEVPVRSGPYSPHCGWFALAIPGEREGLVGGWEWSGPMEVVFGDRQDPCLIHGGLDTDQLALPIAPGQELALPTAWFGFYEGDLDDAARLSHLLVDELAPPRPAAPWPWVGYCTWAASIDESSPFNAGSHPWFPVEANVISQAEAAASAGCELFLWDYGWFPRVGDWWCDPVRYPKGPGRVVRAVKSLGMKLGLWVGFGNADDDSRVVREHPEWLATYQGKPIPDAFFTRTAASTWKTRALCLGHEPVRAWVKHQLERVIESFSLDWLKHDFDIITVCQDDKHTHPPGDGRFAACQGFYEIMDFVRSRWPALVCENWMNNSGVPDYGAIQRHHVQLIGDAYRPFQLRQMFYGHVQMFPPDRQHRYLTLDAGAADLRTQVRSASMGGPWTLLTDLRRLSPPDLAQLRQEIEIYKGIRPLLAGAQVFRLLSRPHPGAWDAIQFHNEQAGKGVLYVFRGAHPASRQDVRLRGVGEVEATDAISGRRAESRGAEIAVELSSPGTSGVYVYRSAPR
jgi:hypothetical protein